MSFPFLVIDVGNTHTDLALFDGDRLVRRFRWSSRSVATAADLAAAWPADMGIASGSVPLVLSTVVTGLGDVYRAWWPGLHLVTPDDPALGIAVGRTERRYIGTDRLVACAGAIAKVGAPVIVVDSGTAATLNVVSADRTFLGGAILPGLHSGLNGLVAAAPRLQIPELDQPVDQLGRTTAEAMRFGAVRGHAAALEGMIRAARDVVGPAPAVGTGGSMPLVSSWIRGLDHVEPDLVLWGLHAIGLRRFGDG